MIVALSATEIALFGHILGVLAFVSGLVVASVVFEAARRRDAPADIAVLLGVARIGVMLALPGAALVLACGLWLVHLEGIGLGTAWIQWAIGLLVVALALGAVGGRQPKRARHTAERLAANGAPMSDELRALLDDRASLAVNWLAAAIVVAIVALMVFKP